MPAHNHYCNGHKDKEPIEVLLEEPFLDYQRVREGLSVAGKHYAKPLRPFVAWDGEGITKPNPCPEMCPNLIVAQDYVLLGNSLGHRMTSKCLTTEDCFGLLLEAERDCPDAIHIGFGMQYDFNMMLKSLSLEALWKLYQTHHVNFMGYRIEYRPRKWLNIGKGKENVRLYDCWGFFQGSFIKAVERYVGKESEDYRRVVKGKQRRANFSFDEIDDYIVPYWNAELRLLVQIMDTLRNDLYDAGFSLTHWYGPGAIANVVLKHYNIKSAKAEPPKEVNRAAQYAYGGGRFELFQAGTYTGPVWEYDIHSAYPSFISELPNLQTGTWEHVRTFERSTFGVWRVDYRSNNKGFAEWYAPNPLFCRDERGNVSYPPMVQGWYWTPEAELVDQTYIKEGWVFRGNQERPFAWVQDLYSQRLEWIEQGISAERTLKLILNSLYGKTAQRIGWNNESDSLPQWHQLEWAGYVTSGTRAKLWKAINQSPQSVIAVETDAIFSTCALELDVGKGLGQWEETKFDGVTYLQNNDTGDTIKGV